MLLDRQGFHAAMPVLYATAPGDLALKLLQRDVSFVGATLEAEIALGDFELTRLHNRTD